MEKQKASDIGGEKKKTNETCSVNRVSINHISCMPILLADMPLHTRGFPPTLLREDTDSQCFSREVLVSPRSTSKRRAASHIHKKGRTIARLDDSIGTAFPYHQPGHRRYDIEEL